MDALASLQRPDLPQHLARLGVDAQDRGSVLDVIARVTADDAAVATVESMAGRLLLEPLGQWRDLWEREGFPEAGCDHAGMRNALPLCALVATADAVHDWQRARGVPADVSWASLADLGLQVARCRRVSGRPGLLEPNWCRNVWAGDFVRLGRLQFELSEWEMPDDEPGTTREVVLNTHIPADGALDAAEVSASLLQAPEAFGAWFADLLPAGGVRWIGCDSWLLDRELAAMVPGSRIADFAHRWHPLEVHVNDRDGYFFGFNSEPPTGANLPFMLDELPTGTRLEQALVARWRAGGHVQVTRGRLPAGRDRA